MTSGLFHNVLNASLESVSLSRLDLSERAHCLSFGRDLEPLVRSIRTVGLLQPLWVSGGKDDLFTILSGFRRAEALVELGAETVPCRVLNGSPDPFSSLNLAFWENLSHRGFNIVEKAFAVQGFCAVSGPEKTMETVMPALGLHPHVREMERMQKIAGLPGPILWALVEGRIFPDPALHLYEFPESDRMPVFRFLESLNPNLNQQKEFLELLLDLSLRDAVSAADILEQEEVLHIVNHSAWSTPQKADRMKRWLRDQLYPRLNAVETAFDDQIRRLRLPGKLRISHAPYFETDGLRMTLDTSNEGELLEMIRDLERASETGGLEKLYKIVSDLE